MKGLLVLLAVAAVAAVMDWKKGVHFAFIIVVLEGAIRKWILPGEEQSIYFLKDAALAIAYWKYHSEIGVASLNRVPRIIICLLVIVVAYLSCSAFNPRLSSIFVGIFGLKAYIFYVPLFWMARDFFNTPRELERFIKIQLTLAVPVFLLAYLQYFAPSYSIINIYANNSGEDMMEIATMGSTENVRVTGTFPYISGMGCFVNLITLLSVIAYSFGSQYRLRTLGMICFFMSMVVGFMTGSRSVVFLQGWLVLGMLFTTRYLARGTFVGLARLTFIAAVFGIVLKFSVVTQAVDAFFSRVEEVGDTLASFAGPLISVVEEAPHAGLIGYGAGATHQARPAIERLVGVPNTADLDVFFEWEFPRICCELGILGFVFWFIFRLAIMALPFFCFRGARSGVGRGVAILVGVFLATQYTLPSVFNHVFSLYFWFIGGLSLAVVSWRDGPRRMMHISRGHRPVKEASAIEGISPANKLP